MVISLHIKKYKLILGTYVTIFKDIRRMVWQLQELYSKDDEIRKDIEASRNKIISLKNKTQDLLDKGKIDPGLIKDAKELKKHLNAFAERFSAKIKQFQENTQEQIKALKRIDFDGEALAFKEIKRVRWADKRIKRRMNKLQKQAEKSDNQELINRVNGLNSFMEQKIKELDTKVISAMKYLWNHANRQAIEGAEIHEAISTESKEKMTRVIKVDAKKSRRLTDTEKKLKKKVNKKMSVNKYKEVVEELFIAFSQETNELKNMGRNLRIYNYRLESEINEIAGKIESVGSTEDKERVQEMDNILRESRRNIEDHYRWLFHEAEKMLS